ncbi:MAG: hypothetical protein V1489_01460 [Candidatus Liptonbacteria bacterium]
MSRRLRKQFIYGLLYLSIIALIAVAVYYTFLRPGPSCTNGRLDPGEEGLDCGSVCAKVCIPVDLAPLKTVGSVQLFKPATSTIELVAKAQNSNQGLAAKSFSYSFDIFDASGNKVDTIFGDSYMYAGEVKYIAAIKTNVPYDAVRATFGTGAVSWVKNADYARPVMSGVLSKQITTTSSTVTVQGRIADKDVIGVDNVTVTALFYGEFGSLLGVSETELGPLAPEEDKQFTILHPAVVGIAPQRTDLIITVKRP